MAFFGSDLQNWMSDNLSSRGRGGKFHEFRWDFVFAYGCWTLWKNRCSAVLAGNGNSIRGLLIHCHTSLTDHKRFIKSQAYCGIKKTSQIHIRWIPPIGDAFKFNVDGSVRGCSSACGGVLRDRNGIWVCGFSRNIGSSTITMAELLAILDAMKIAVKLGIREVIFESDSSVAVHLVSSGIHQAHPCGNIISQIRGLAHNFTPEFQLQHTYREANSVADWMANYGHKLSHGLHEFHVAVNDCSVLLDNDFRGVSLPRRVLG